MSEAVISGLGVLIQVLEVVGAGALVLGFIVATTRCVREARQFGAVAAIDRYRMALGRAILIGLEILVAAAIVKTITLEPSMRNIGMLAGMIVVRTMLGWTTMLEISGRWPWQGERS